MADRKTHYNIRIIVEKVEHIPTSSTTGYSGGRQTEQVLDSKRVVTEAGKVDLKHTNFDMAKDLAAKHLALLTEFEGSDPRKGTTRD